MPKKICLLLALVGAYALGCGNENKPERGDKDCGDKVDNDKDGKIDCDDDGCAPWCDDESGYVD